MAQVFKTSRWLRPYESQNGHQIFIRVRMRSGAEFNIPVCDFVNNEKIPISVKKKYWEKGFIKGGQYHISLRDLNNLLSNVESNVKDALNELIERNITINTENIFKLTYINELTAEENNRRIASGEVIVDEQGGPFASQQEFIEFIDESNDPQYNELKKSLGLYRKVYILDYWDEFLMKYAPDSYNAPKYAIEDYIKKTDDNCKAYEFSSQWLQRFFAYVIKNGYSFKNDGTNRQPYTISTISKYKRHLFSFGDYLFTELKILNNQDYKRFKLIGTSKKQSLIKYKASPYINTQALYKKEFDLFFAYDFEDKDLGLARDMFVLQVWLGGLRKSDFFKLTQNNIQKDANGKFKIFFEQQKTADEVINPVNQNYVQPILEKYPAGLKLIPTVKLYHKLLRMAAKQAGLNRQLMFRDEVAKDDRATITWHPIYEKICNKWARNCTVSILAEEGYPDDRISKFTGHRDIEMIKHYKQIHGKDVDLMINAVKPETE